MSFENLGGQSAAFAREALIMRTSPGLTRVGENFRALLAGSEMLAARQGMHLQDALSLRAVPHVHGAARDVFAHVAEVVNRELDSATDNPLVGGTPEAPEVFSGAHAVGAAIGLAMDSLSTAVAEVAAMAERRLRKAVPTYNDDRPLAVDMNAAGRFIRQVSVGAFPPGA